MRTNTISKFLKLSNIFSTKLFLSKIIFCVGIICLITSCVSLLSLDKHAKIKGDVLLSAPTLRFYLEDFWQKFNNYIQGSADKIASDSSQRTIKQKAIFWKLQIITQGEDILAKENPLGAYLDLGIFCIQMREFFENGEGKQLFELQTIVALETCRQLEKEILEINKKLFVTEKQNHSKKAMYDFAKQNPMHGNFIRSSIQPEWNSNQSQEKNTVEKSLYALAALPLSPLSPFQTFDGVTDAALAIEEFSHVASRSAKVLVNMPNLLRWQMELLLYDIEARDSTVSTINNFSRISQSAEQVADTFEQLPLKVRQEALYILEKTSHQQESLRKTIVEVQKVLSEIEKPLTQVQEIISPLEKATNSFAQAGEEWKGALNAYKDMVQELYRKEPSTSKSTLVNEEENKKENEKTKLISHLEKNSNLEKNSKTSSLEKSSARPFDINEYAQAMESLALAATNLHTLVQEVNNLIVSEKIEEKIDQVDKRTRQTLLYTRKESEELIDHLILRLAQLATFIFILFLIYRSWGAKFKKK